jgi:hypothetical protein
VTCWTKPLRGGKTAAILILSLWERLSNREKSWQNATHTVLLRKTWQCAKKWSKIEHNE